jgi:hypothetical protein
MPGADATSGQFLIPVALISEGQPPAASPLAQDTFNASLVQVRRFTGTGWADATPVAANITYEPGASQVVLTFDPGSLAADNRYRISLSQPPEAPVVDVKMRPLHPGRFAHQVRLVADGSVLKVADSLF